MWGPPPGTSSSWGSRPSLLPHPPQSQQQPVMMEMMRGLLGVQGQQQMSHFGIGQPSMMMIPPGPGGGMGPIGPPPTMSLNPVHYTNVPHDQVDWAALAQQWIQMKDSPPAPPPPQSLENLMQQQQMNQQHTQQPQHFMSMMSNTAFHSPPPSQQPPQQQQQSFHQQHRPEQQQQHFDFPPTRNQIPHGNHGQSPPNANNQSNMDFMIGMSSTASVLTGGNNNFGSNNTSSRTHAEAWNITPMKTQPNKWKAVGEVDGSSETCSAQASWQQQSQSLPEETLPKPTVRVPLLADPTPTPAVLPVPHQSSPVIMGFQGYTTFSDSPPPSVLPVPVQPSYESNYKSFNSDGSYWATASESGHKAYDLEGQRKLSFQSGGSGGYREYSPEHMGLSETEIARRRALPAWIREGLEKVEQEKRKEKEKETNDARKEEDRRRRAEELNIKASKGGNQFMPSKWAVPQQDSDSDEDVKKEEEEIKSKISSSVMSQFIMSSNHGSKDQAVKIRGRSRKTEKEELREILNALSPEDRMAQIMRGVKGQLTQILLEVTNREIASIAEESLNHAKEKEKGLGGYGSNSDDSGSESGSPSEDDNPIVSSKQVDSEEELLTEMERRKRNFELRELEENNEEDEGSGSDSSPKSKSRSRSRSQPLRGDSTKISPTNGTSSPARGHDLSDHKAPQSERVDEKPSIPMDYHVMKSHPEYPPHKEVEAPRVRKESESSGKGKEERRHSSDKSRRSSRRSRSGSKDRRSRDKRNRRSHSRSKDKKNRRSRSRDRHRRSKSKDRNRRSRSGDRDRNRRHRDHKKKRSKHHRSRRDTRSSSSSSSDLRDSRRRRVK